MKTTNLIVEIVIIGFFSLIWLGLIILSQLDSNILEIINDKYALIKDFPMILVTILLIASYQIGWLINALCHWSIRVLWIYLIRKPKFRKEELDFNEVRAAVYCNAVSHTIDDLLTDRYANRIARASILNFAILSIVIIIYYSDFKIIGFVCATIAILSIFLSIHLFNRYHKRLISTYKHLMKKSDCSKKESECEPTTFVWTVS